MRSTGTCRRGASSPSSRDRAVPERRGAWAFCAGRPRCTCSFCAARTIIITGIDGRRGVVPPTAKDQNASTDGASLRYGLFTAAGLRESLFSFYNVFIGKRPCGCHGGCVMILGRPTCRVTVLSCRGRAGTCPDSHRPQSPVAAGGTLAKPSKAVGTRGTGRAASARERRHERDFRRRFKTT
jgi:hypothetical protein